MPPRTHQATHEGNTWVYDQAVAARVQQIVMVGSIYSNKHKSSLYHYEAWERCLLHITAHRIIAPDSTSRPRFTILDFTPTFEEIQQDMDILATQAALACEDAYNPLPSLSAASHGILQEVNPIAAKDVAAHVVSVLGDDAWFDRRCSIGGPQTYSWLTIANACFHALGLPPQLHLQPLWQVTLYWYLVCLGAALGMPGCEEQAQALGATRVRWVMPATGDLQVGQGDLVQHLSDTGWRIRARFGIPENQKWLSRQTAAAGGLHTRGPWWSRVGAPIMLLFGFLLLVERFV